MKKIPGWVAVLGFSAALLGGVAAAVAAPSATAPATAPVPDVVAAMRWCGEEQAGNRTLAAALRHRERELDEREHSFGARQVELTAAEKRLDARMAALTKLRTEIEASLVKTDSVREERVKGLVKMVESNRPASIAPMFSALEEPLAVEVLDRMNRTKAGKLLGALSAAKAASLASKLTRPLQAEVP